MWFCLLLFFLEGKKHDARMLADSGLLHLLQRHAVSPFRNAVLTPDMQALNASIGAVRVSVKCLLGDIVIFFKFTDFKQKFENRTQ